VECGLPRFELEAMVHMISDDEEQQEEASTDCTLADGVWSKRKHWEILFIGQLPSYCSQCTVRRDWFPASAVIAIGR
jgi:hypothetical protein